MRITLTRQDVHKAETLGRDTVAICEKLMKFNPRLENDKQSREAANIAGFKAEIAIARLYELDLPELNILSDGGLDLWIGDPRRKMYSIDAKWTSTQDLIFDCMEKFQADFAIGVTSIAEDSMEVHGFVSRRRFEKKAVSKDYKYGPRLVMPLDDLSPPELLWKFITSEKLNTREEA